MDVGTTILDLAKANPLPGASGRSLRPLLEERKGKWNDTAFSEYEERGSRLVCRMVRKGPWKYNYYHKMKPELFNLEKDPGETQNLSGKPAFRKIEKELKKLVLEKWNPDLIAEYMERRNRELGLIGNWVNTTSPSEPDPLWFSKDPENYVDNTITGPEK